MWYNQVAVYNIFVFINTGITQKHEKNFANSIPQRARAGKSYRQLLVKKNPQRIAVT